MAEAKDVTITPFTVDYVPEVFKLIDEGRDHLSKYDDPTAKKYPDVQSVFDSVRYPRRPLAERFVVLAAGEPVGSINIHPLDEIKSEYEVGYWIGERHIGHGFAVQGVERVKEFAAQERPSIDILAAFTHPDNTASQRVLTKAGFTSYIDTTTHGKDLWAARYFVRR